MAYSRGKSKGSSTRLTGLFATKRKGLFVGTARPEDIANLIEKIKEAKAAGKGLTFFVWKNDPGRGPALSLSADVARDRQDNQDRSPRKPIENDPFDSDDETENDDPFGDN